MEHRLLIKGFPGGVSSKEPTCQGRRQTWVRSLGQEDPLEEEMATHSSILAWRLPWTEEPDGFQSMGLQRVGYDWSDLAHINKRRIKCNSKVLVGISLEVVKLFSWKICWKLIVHLNSFCLVEVHISCGFTCYSWVDLMVSFLFHILFAFICGICHVSTLSGGMELIFRPWRLYVVVLVTLSPWSKNFSWN